jgi:hypothetical protein
MITIILMELGRMANDVDRMAIEKALDTIRKVSDLDLTISRAAISEIELMVEAIDSLTRDPEVKREGQYLVSRVLGRLAEPPEVMETSSVVWSARLHGAVARYEFALRRAGFLPPAGGGESDQPRESRMR